ncbi:MAG: cytochrome c [Planctomycetes bacterium]|nr:cytochrome c [Planctomycetota bacterium]
MKTYLRNALLFAASGLAFAWPFGDVTSQTGKVVPKLEPIAETRLLMEAIAHANFRGLERNLTKKEIDEQSWVFARGQALLIAETANLLMLRPPKNQGEAVWFERSMDLRKQAMLTAQEVAKKDVERSKASLRSLAASCNRCHQSFRVPIEIAPFQQPDAPPLRKVVHVEN